MYKHQLLKQAGMLEAYIKTGKCKDKRRGLCHNVLMENGDYDYWDEAFRAWTEFRGSIAYPVEGHSSRYETNVEKHDRRTKYGKLRLSLAKHCLEYVMNKLREVV
jgi:hypothetical protein